MSLVDAVGRVAKSTVSKWAGTAMDAKQESLRHRRGDPDDGLRAVRRGAAARDLRLLMWGVGRISARSADRSNWGALVWGLEKRARWLRIESYSRLRLVE